MKLVEGVLDVLAAELPCFSLVFGYPDPPDFKLWPAPQPAKGRKHLKGGEVEEALRATSILRSGMSGIN
jgi:hypothetical protein